MTLTEFLLARIAEDEDAASAAVGRAVWRENTGEWISGGAGLVFAVTAEGERTQVGDFSMAWDQQQRRTHIARHDPARVLTECEAKRRIVTDRAFRESQNSNRLSIFGERILGEMATVYSDHPDYRQEWKP